MCYFKDELDRHYYLKTSDVLTDEDRILFTNMLHGQDETILPCLAMGGAQGGIGGTTNYNGIKLGRYH